jgi:hypothetical protein
MEVGVHGTHIERRELKSLGRLFSVEPEDGDGFGAGQELVNNLLKNPSRRRTDLETDTQTVTFFAARQRTSAMTNCSTSPEGTNTVKILRWRTPFSFIGLIKET